MRPSRIFRLIIRMFLLLLTVSMSLVSFLGGLSAVLILGVDENGDNNIQIPSGPVSSSLNISAPETMTLDIPFKITNAGYFDLTNLELWVKLKMEYSWWNHPSPALNETRSALIFNKSLAFDPIIAGATLETNFTGTGAAGGGFITANIPDPDPFTGDINYYMALNFTIDIELTCTYSLGLLDLGVEIFDHLVESILLTLP